MSLFVFPAFANPFDADDAHSRQKICRSQAVRVQKRQEKSRLRTVSPSRVNYPLNRSKNCGKILLVELSGKGVYMANRILVAGGGHGGIAAAALLARRGYSVTVYEKHAREAMGYDWTDIFDGRAFAAVGMEYPQKGTFRPKPDMTFYSPSLTVPVRQRTTADTRDIQMERKEIYNRLISYAQQAGVTFVYRTQVLEPVIFGNRVVGIRTEQGIEYADLVIDAAGIDSPLRSRLPASLGIQNHVDESEQLYVYRGFYEKAADITEDKFKFLLLHQNIPGLCWVAAEKDYTDVLIGRFHAFDMDEVESTLQVLRQSEKCLGTKLLRGGCFARIPVRQPLGVLVADGYAAIGDSAFMTMPVIGSGIANSLRAAAILARAVTADKSGAFSAQTLWNYQRGFYKEIGNKTAPLACVTQMLAKCTGSELDYIFESGILHTDDMAISVGLHDMDSILGILKPDGVKRKLKGLAGNRALRSKLLQTGVRISEAAAVTAAMPKAYDDRKVTSWVKKYDACFKR